MRRLFFIAALVSSQLVPLQANAASESEQPILTISGRIGKSNTVDKKAYAFTFKDLQKVGDVQITSTTRYVGIAKFTGPKIIDLLKTVHAASDAVSVSVVALDGYQVTIPIKDFTKWDVITAHTQNGRRLTIDTKGPLWIMYPNDKHPNELLNNETTTKLVWALTGLVVN